MILLLAGLAAAVPLLTQVVPVSAPAGVRAEWSFLNGCNPTVRVHNGTKTPVEVDWMRSVVATDGAAVALVPGSTSEMASRISIPPMVIPPGAYGEEMLFRKDRLPSADGGCILEPATLTFTLAIGTAWLVEKVEVSVDVEAAQREAAELEARQAEAARQLEEARQAELEARQAEATRRAAEAKRTAYATCLKAKEERERRNHNRNIWAWGTLGVLGGIGTGNIAVGAFRLHDQPVIGSDQIVVGIPQLLVGASVWAGLYFTMPDVPVCVEPPPI